MITKKYFKSRKVCKVTIELPLEQIPDNVKVETVGVAGEFNQWRFDSSPMRYSKNKKCYRAQIDLFPGRAYQFRYVINGSIWLNDWHADAYVPNNVQGDNSVVFPCNGE